MLKRWIGLLFIFFAHPAFSQEPVISQAREPGQDWEEALSKNMQLRGENVLSPQNAIEVSDYETRDVGGIPQWKNGLVALQELYNYSRHLRRYNNPNRGNFLRKAPWLYPVDGCFVRAAHVSSLAQARKYPPPGKALAFGRLKFKTPYARRGDYVYWSYHVAPAYHISGIVYVIDPGLESGLLTLPQWLAKISDNPEKVRVSLCDSHLYSPRNRCRGGKGTGAYLGHMSWALKNEWSHLKSKGLSPEALLGP